MTDPVRLSASGPGTDPITDPITDPVARACDVLGQEAAALTRLAADLPEDFAPAIATILAANGRVIVSGLGKSGHVGRKIAATLASTGTPSDFLHAAEAAHGDMGMIVPGDVALLLSKSGETAELAPILAYVTRFDIPLIAISQVMDSTLMRAADHRLILPDLPEACPIGMAPTTSTTMMLGLGDALATALLAARGFGTEDFRTLHPGGKLGAQLKRVADLMHGGDALPLVEETASMEEVLLTMTARGFGIAVLVRDGRVSGVITDGDLRRSMAGLMERRPVEVASGLPVTVLPGCLASEALALMNARKIMALLVVDAADRPQGIVHMHDLLRAGTM